jgi:hypothetical protein
MSLRPSERLYQHRGNVLVTAPSVEPVTLAEVKAALVISGTADDAFITALITEARQEIEDVTGLALITQEWKLTLDHWPQGRGDWWDGVRQAAISEIYAGRPAFVSIPRYPLASVDVVTVYGLDGIGQAVSVATVFDVDTQQRPGRLALKSGQTWPIALRDTNAIEIEYTAGFGATAGYVPAQIKRAIRQMASYMYSHRGDGCTPSDAYEASGAGAVLGRYQVARI